MKDYSLVDSKVFGVNKGKKYNSDKKLGRKSTYFAAIGVAKTKKIINQEDINLFVLLLIK